MMLIVGLDSISILALVFAFICLAVGWKRVTEYDIRYLLAALLGLSLFYAIDLWVEWTGLSMALEPFEDFTGALLPMMWAFVFYAFVKWSMTQDLRDSEENLRVTLASIGDAVIATTREGAVSRMNPTAEILTGWKTEEALGKPLTEVFNIVNSRSKQPVANPVEKVIETGTIIGLANHTMLVSKDGAEYQIADAAAPILNTAGEIIGVVLIFRDVTEEYWLNERIRENEERMELALKGANLCTWDHDIQGERVIFNTNWARMMGYDPDDIIHTINDWKNMVHPDDLPAVDKSMFEYLTGDTVYYENEFRLVHKDGHTIWVQVKGRIIRRDEDGRPLRICGTYLDVTEHIRAQAALQESKTLLRTLVDTMPDLVWLKDPEGVFLSCNKQFELLSGAREADIIGKTDFDFVDKEQALYFRGKDKAAIAAGRPCLNEEEVVYASDGHKAILETIKTPMLDSSGKLIGVLGIARDITERRQAETEREKLQDQLIQSQKMEAVGRLAGGVAHDLNNLLSPIIGYSEFMMEEAQLDEDGRNSLDEILHAGLRARDLVSQLLAFSRKQTLEFKPVNINETIERFGKLLRRTIPEDIAIDTNLASTIPPVMADIGNIEQIIMNLALNAADAMPHGGKLTIETGVDELDEEYAASHPGVTPGSYVMLGFSDTGHGMDQETLDHIFEPFYTTKGKYGTGLGLATVFGIVKQHNGNIWLYSEPDHGTTFKIYLPVSDKTSIEVTEGNHPKTVAKGNETILLVEDDDQVRQLANTILKRYGYNVYMATNSGEALTALKSHDGPIYLLLTDVVMPGMNGRQLYEQAAKLYPAMKVLYMSGYSDDVIANRGVLEEGVNFIQKPFTAQKLAAKVREVLDGA